MGKERIAAKTTPPRARTPVRAYGVNTKSQMSKAKPRAGSEYTDLSSPSDKPVFSKKLGSSRTNLSMKEPKVVERKQGRGYSVTLRSNLAAITKLIHDLDLRPIHIEGLSRTPFWLLFNAILQKRLSIAQCRKFDDIIVSIIGTYDAAKRCFRLGGQVVRLTREDIKLIFGIQCGRMPMNTWYASSKSIGLVRRRSLGNSRLSGPSIICLLKSLVHSDEGDDVDDVVRLLCLFLCLTLFFSTTTSTINWAYLEHIDNLDRINDYDWCEQIRNTLMRSIHNHYRRPKQVSGCAIALLYWLCEHTNIASADYPTALPRFLKWSTLNVHKVFKDLILNSLIPNQVQTCALTQTKEEVKMYGAAADMLDSETGGNDADEESDSHDTDIVGTETGTKHDQDVPQIDIPINYYVSESSDNEESNSLHDGLDRIDGMQLDEANLKLLESEPATHDIDACTGIGSEKNGDTTSVPAAGTCRVQQLEKENRELRLAYEMAALMNANLKEQLSNKAEAIIHLEKQLDDLCEESRQRKEVCDIDAETKKMLISELMDKINHLTDENTRLTDELSEIAVHEVTQKLQQVDENVDNGPNSLVRD